MSFRQMPRRHGAGLVMNRYCYRLAGCWKHAKKSELRIDNYVVVRDGDSYVRCFGMKNA